MNRGIIAPPGKITIKQGGFQMKGGLTPEEIRYYLMYWDKVIIPDNNLISIGIPGEEELIKCGAIWRPRVKFQGAFDAAQAMLGCQAIIAEQMLKDKSTDWVIHQIGQEATALDNFSHTQNVIRVDLSNVLPAPHGDVPIHDVLDFKERRKTELAALHETLDDIYLEILSSPDNELAAKKCTSRFEDSIKDLDKVSKEKFKRVGRFDLSAELNLNGKDIVNGAASGAVLDFFSNGFTMPIATTIGAIGSAIKISAKSTKSLTSAKERTKLSYLSSAHKEEVLHENS